MYLDLRLDFVRFFLFDCFFLFFANNANIGINTHFDTMCQ